MKKRFIGSIMVTVFICIFGFVGKGEAQQYGGTLKLGMYSDIHTPDLHRTVGNPTAQFAILVSEPMLAYDEQCNLVPELVESWKVSPDATECTFFVRKGVLFHNGRELTAEDLKKNVDHMRNPKTRSPFRAQFKSIKKSEVIDKYTVKFYFKESYADFLSPFRRPLYITAPESFESNPPHPIGTGPFEFVEWKARQYVKVRRFKGYWKKDKNGNQLPYVDEVILKPITDDTVRYMALRTGDVDWIWALPFEQILEMRKNPPEGVVPSIRGGVRWIHLNLNCASGPTKDFRVRQAIAYALDKKALLDGLTWGIAPFDPQIFPPGNKWYVEGVEDPYAEANLPKARQLLKEAGYEKGVQLNAIVRNETFIMNLALLAQGQLRKAGIDLRLEMMDRASHQSWQVRRQFNVNPTHLAFYPEPDSLYARYFHSGERQNYAGYNNPEYDKLVEEASRTLEIEKRKGLYAKALGLLHRDLPHIFFGHYPIVQASRTYLKNMKSNARGDIVWAYGGAAFAWIEK